MSGRHDPMTCDLYPCDICFPPTRTPSGRRMMSDTPRETLHALYTATTAAPLTCPIAGCPCGATTADEHDTRDADQ